PVTSFAAYEGRLWLPWLVCAAVMMLMAGTYLRVEIGRGIIGFGFILLAASAVQAFLQPQHATDSSFFAGYWLRCEFVIWILMPWIMSLLAGIIAFSWRARLFWIAVTPAYGIVWSAVRLTFCTGLLYFAGPALVGLLWFSFGILADLLFLCAFYSF